jgi:hypothetical protein
MAYLYNARGTRIPTPLRRETETSAPLIGESRNWFSVAEIERGMTFGERPQNANISRRVPYRRGRSRSFSSDGRAAVVGISGSRTTSGS